MTWLQRYHLREFRAGSFWLAPMLVVFLAIIAANLLRAVDGATGWRWFNFTPDGAKEILSAFVSSMLTFFVFVASSLLLVVQLASAQLTPRIIAPALRNVLVRISLSALIFSYVYSITLLGRIEGVTPQLSVLVAIIANLASIVFFTFFVGKAGVALRPIAILTRVAGNARTIIDVTYPLKYDARLPKPPPRSARKLGELICVITNQGSSRVLLTFDERGLVALARRHGCVIELVPQVGDFVPSGNVILNIYGGTVPPERLLHHSLALGSERTMEKDPAFAFRIIVDIASKALSPGINDPTTAVLAIDQIHRLLRWVGTRQLDSGYVVDSSGNLRLFYRTPTWDDFVRLGTSEIRMFGADSLQVARRLRAMLDDLKQTLPPDRASPLNAELALLDRAIQRAYVEPEDRLLAGIGDYQGIGSIAPTESAAPVQ